MAEVGGEKTMDLSLQISRWSPSRSMSSMSWDPLRICSCTVQSLKQASTVTTLSTISTPSMNRFTLLSDCCYCASFLVLACWIISPSLTNRDCQRSRYEMLWFAFSWLRVFDRFCMFICVLRSQMLAIAIRVFYTSWRDTRRPIIAPGYFRARQNISLYIFVPSPQRLSITLFLSLWKYQAVLRYLPAFIKAFVLNQPIIMHNPIIRYLNFDGIGPKVNFFLSLTNLSSSS